MTISHQHPHFVAFLRYLADAEQIKQCLDKPGDFQARFCAFLGSLTERHRLFATSSVENNVGRVLVNVPEHSVDIQLSLPEHEVTVKWRDGSLTLILPDETCVTNWQKDLTPAEAFLGLSSDTEITKSHFAAGHVRLAQQIVIDLRGKNESE
mgnify:CR=1 FL=1